MSPLAQLQCAALKGAAVSMQPASEKVGRVRRFFDISVPRNVAADVSDLEGARVFNVDDLKEVSAHTHIRLPHSAARVMWKQTKSKVFRTKMQV